MAKVIVTAQVQDAAKWEASFRTHHEIFRTYNLTAPVAYTVSGNEVAVCMETGNVDTFMQALSLPATTDAMASDGVKKETLKIHVLDKSLSV